MRSLNNIFYCSIAKFNSNFPVNILHSQFYAAAASQRFLNKYIAEHLQRRWTCSAQKTWWGRRSKEGNSFFRFVCRARLSSEFVARDALCWRMFVKVVGCLLLFLSIGICYLFWWIIIEMQIWQKEIFV